MRVAQIILPSASQYERKSQRADRAALSSPVQLVDEWRDADVAHVYAGAELPGDLRIEVPYVSSHPMQHSRWRWRRSAEPARVVTWRDLPEVVEDAYFAGEAPARDTNERAKVVGSYARRRTVNIVEQTFARIQRFREDVIWNVFDAPPLPADLRGVDVWVDPALDEDDLDGFVAEAVVSGIPVVATRIEVNSARLEKGRTGFLVPPNDPNEMTHAILAALFKSEVAQAKIEAARQTAPKFRARHRLRMLSRLYEALNP
jgi:ketosteroid isomerase-like protein